MTATSDLELLRAVMALEKNAAETARAARAILDREPAHEAAALLLATALQRLGNLHGAVEVLETAAGAQPVSASVQLELGRSYGEMARTEEARSALERAIEIQPGFAEAWNALSIHLLRIGDVPAADRAYGNYRRFAADPPDLMEAYAAFDGGRFDAAAHLVQQRLLAGTNAVAAHTLLSAIAGRRGDDMAEAAELLEVLRLAPCDSTAREQLARLMLRQGRAHEALPLIERLRGTDPASREFAVLHADALRLADRHAEGLDILMRLIGEFPQDPDLWLLAGNQRRYLGSSAQAIEAYRRCIALNPQYGAAYLALSNMKTFRFSQGELAAMQGALAHAPPEPSVTHLHFALGKAMEDAEQFAESFQHYAAGNRGARTAFNYNAGAQAGYVQRFKATFDTEFFAQRRGWGNDSTAPIFIVGLPRSGSTLLEQILASHSQIEGTRELVYVPVMARELAGPAAGAAAYPENLRSLQASDVGALAERYLEGAGRHRPLGKPRFIDKMHGNFASIGLIHLMFPRAVIIDARRHPLACGFACFKQLFSPGMNFAYDLTEIGTYYRDYAELMRHVDDVLPGRVWRVHYEHVIANAEREIRELLRHCGLTYESDCLRFHENRRIAQTLSSEQVRLPLYREGLEQWRHFEHWLDPLSAALGPLVDEYPGVSAR